MAFGGISIFNIQTKELWLKMKQEVSRCGTDGIACSAICASSANNAA